MLSFASAKEVQQYCSAEDVEFITLYIPDIDGRLRNVTIPAENFTDTTVKEGIGFDASNLGFAKVNKSDMVLRPDLNCAFADPVNPDSHVLYFLCNVVEVDTFAPFPQDLRHIVGKSMAALKNEGLADEALVGVELEFFVIDDLYSIMTPRETSFRVESSELASPASGEELYRIYTKRGYHRSEPNDHIFEIRNEIVSAFKKLGLKTKYHHHEVGSSQAEIEFELLPVEYMADATVLAKNICHRIAHKHQKVITFIPKLIPGEAGSGMHIHHFLKKDGVNIFNEEGGLYDLSQTALSYLAGILKHASSLLAFTNPTTNSYRRLVPGFEAPVKAVFAKANRSAAIRVPGYIQDPETRRFEFRTIDATCNPYLAYAAVLMAGLDGVKSQLDPTAEGFGPLEKNLYELPEEELRKIKSFPSTLEEALDALGKDRDYLLHAGVFPDSLIQQWVAAKQSDINEMRQVPHPWEIARFYDI